MLRGSVNQKIMAKKLNTVHVFFTNSAYNFSTNVSAETTEAIAKKYYVGMSFNVGAYPQENFQLCTGIDYVDNNVPELPEFTRAEDERFNVLSPDGFTLTMDEQYNTVEEAQEAFNNWKKRYEAQGYYSSNRGRIPLDELEQCCTLITQPVYEDEETGEKEQL